MITDVMLPGRSGLHLVGELRRRPATQRMPMIVLTARHGADATAEGLAAGADDYITKPFSVPGTAGQGARQPRTAPAAGNAVGDGRGPRPSRSAPRWTATGSSAPPSAS